MQPRRSSETWSMILEDWKRSGLGLREYAARHGLRASTLQWWRWNLRAVMEKRQAKASSAAITEFVPLELVRNESRSGLRLRIDGLPIALEIDQGFAPELLRAVIDALC